jgi:hypothetical protein
LGEAPAGAEEVIGGNNGAQRHPAEFFSGAADEK